MELTKTQLDRQDFVDNKIYNLLKELNPGSVNIDWNIELIGEVRDAVEKIITERLCICSSKDFYPFLDE